MNDDFENVVRKISAKTSIIIIILFMMIFLACVLSFKLKSEISNINHAIGTIPIPEASDLSGIYEKIDNIKNTPCPAFTSEISDQLLVDNMKLLQAIYMARDRMYMGSDFYNFLVDYKELNNDSKVNAFIDDISRFANADFSSVRLLELLDQINSYSEQPTNYGNNHMQKIIDYIGSIIKIKKLDLITHDIDILSHIKLNIINREPEIALKSISDINKKSEKIEILRQNLQDASTLKNIFNDFIHYVLSGNLNKTYNKPSN